MSDRYWDSEVGRWVYPGEAFDNASGARALREAAEDACDYLTTPNVSLRDWLLARAEKLEAGE